MVSRVTRYKVAGIVAVVAVLIYSSIFIYQEDTPSTRMYSASDDQLDLAIVDAITKQQKKEVSHTDPKNKAIIVPHHMVAGLAIAEGVAALRERQPKIVVIISPDHYAKCPTLICTTRGKFVTFFGDVSIGDTEVKELLSHKEIVTSSNLFLHEHGVYSIVPFVRYYLPHATVIPIVLSQHGRGTDRSRTEMVSLVDALVSKDDVALIISTDFSHYLPLQEADEKDMETTTSFCAGNDKEILTLNNPSQSDCPLCLWLLEQEAKKKGFWNPMQIWHSNSAELLHDRSVQETTSHFTFILREASSSEGSCFIKK